MANSAIVRLKRTFHNSPPEGEYKKPKTVNIDEINAIFTVNDLSEAQREMRITEI